MLNDVNKIQIKYEKMAVNIIKQICSRQLFPRFPMARLTQCHSFCHVLASQPKPGVEPEDAHLAPARRPEIFPDFFTRVLNSLPDGRSLTFAYGSGVFEQHDNSKKNNMTDFIVAVKDSRTWHQENMKMNPSHYAGLARYLGYSRIADIQVAT